MPIIGLALLLLTSCLGFDQSKPKIRFVDSKGNPKQLEIKALELNSRSMNQQKLASESKAANENPQITQKNQALVPDSAAQIPANSELTNKSENFLTPPFEAQNSISSQQNSSFKPQTSTANPEVPEQNFIQPSKNSPVTRSDAATENLRNSANSATKPYQNADSNRLTNQEVNQSSADPSRSNSQENQQSLLALPKKETAEPKEILFQLDDRSKNQESFATKDEKSKSEKTSISRAVTPKKERSESSKFYVQVGSFLQKEKAKNLVGNMKEFSQGKVETVQNEDRIIYRALLGPFASKAEARNAAVQIRENGQEAILVKSK